jgi:type I restriction enzyme S subunit
MGQGSVQATVQQLLSGQNRLPRFHGEWEEKTLGEVATFLKGKGLPKSELVPDGTEPCIHYGELFTRYPETIGEIVSHTNSSRDSFRSVANDVLMPTSDVTPRGLAKASCITVNGVILGGDILVIRSDIRRVFGPFLSYIIRHEENQVLRLVTGSTVYHLYGSDMKKFVLSLPPIPEQRAIATALSDVDALLGSLERLIAKKRDLKQAAMQQLLTGQTRLPGFHGEWELKRLGSVAEMGSGGTPTSSVPAFYDGDIPWVSISDMTKGGKVIMGTDRNLTGAGFANSAAQMFQVGTVLYAMYASLGECSIAGISLCSSQAILGICPSDGLSNEFLYYYLTSIKPIVKSLGQQGTQANLNKGMVQNFQFRMPLLPEQRAIAAVLTDMDAELALLEQRLAKTRALKQGMMQELLTGRTRLVFAEVAA